MANPFPGMDPYLEGDLWPSVHLDLTAEIVRRLAPQLRPKYLVLSSRRVVLATPDDTERVQDRLPDVGVVHRADGSGPVAGTAVASPRSRPTPSCPPSTCSGVSRSSTRPTGGS